MCELTQKDNGFELRNIGFPARILAVELKLDGNSVEVVKQTQSSKYSPVENAGKKTSASKLVLLRKLNSSRTAISCFKRQMT